MPRPLLVALSAALVAIAIAAPTAQAGTYRQHTCKLPDGSPAATDGWTRDGAAAFFTQSDECLDSLGLRTHMESTGVSAGTERTWTWTPPANTSIDAVEMFRTLTLTAGNSSGTPTATIASGATVIESHAGSSKGNRFVWNDATNRVASNGPFADSLRVSLGCVGEEGGACPNLGTTKSEARLYAATFTLSDPAAPSPFNVAGSLTTGAVKRGVEQLTYSATDAGAGIYRTIVRVNGATVAATTPHANGGRCADAVPADPDPYEFQHGVPCPLSLTGVQVPLDTRTLVDGVHVLEVAVEDAAGNRATVYGPEAMTVDNKPVPVPPTSPPAGGTPAAPGPAAAATTTGATNGIGGGPSARLSVAVLASSQRLVRIAHGRSVTLSGRLVTQAGAPIANAVVELQARRAVRGAAMAPLATVRTDAAGSFRYVLRPGPSRVIRFGYRARVGDAAFASSADVDVRVKARLSFKLDRATLRNGQTIRYSGRVDGQTRRPLVQVQVRSQGRWVNVCVVRARTGGAYSCRYRFRRTFRPTTYTFRALVKTQEGLPYDTAASASRRLRVRS